MRQQLTNSYRIAETIRDSDEAAETEKSKQGGA